MKGVYAWATGRARSGGQKQSKLVHRVRLPSATAVLHVERPGKLMWDEQGRRMQCWNSRFNAFLSHITSTPNLVPHQHGQEILFLIPAEIWCWKVIQWHQELVAGTAMYFVAWSWLLPGGKWDVLPGTEKLFPFLRTKQVGQESRKKKKAEQVHFCLGILWCLRQFILIHKWIFQVLW